MSTQLSTNAIAFIGLCNEYRAALQSASQSTRDEFIAVMLKLLPRLYISATDLTADVYADAYIDAALDEDFYDAVRRDVESLLGPDDVYLEVFEEDMKYSDTPIAASIAESLADLFQVAFNFLSAVKDAPDEVVTEALSAVKEDFESYWGQTLCNVLRALNRLRYDHTA